MHLIIYGSVIIYTLLVGSVLCFFFYRYYSAKFKIGDMSINLKKKIRRSKHGKSFYNDSIPGSEYTHNSSDLAGYDSSHSDFTGGGGGDFGGAGASGDWGDSGGGSDR